MGRGIRGITKDLYESHGRDFQKRCYSWLKFLYPEILEAKDLGEIDKEGADLYIFNSDRINYEKVFQCKGFEKAFSDSQLKQCIKSIKTFSKAGVWADEYYLIVNVQLNKEYSGKLLIELNQLVENKKVGKAYLLNSNSFVSYYDTELRKLILNKISESNKKFYDDYTTVMEQKFYYENVPFVENDRPSKSPIEFISNYIDNTRHQKGSSGKNKINGKYIFLVSEFGFGKTTTLLELYHRCINNKLIPIYLPATILSNNAFSGTSSITREIFKILFDDIDSEESDKIVRFSSESMTSLLQNESTIILMFDGLDEHLQFYKLEGLRTLFNSTAEFKAPCIFSFRKSYWEERFEDFKLALTKSKINKDYIFLVEWGDNEISNYIELFIDKNSDRLKKNEISRLDHLKQLVNDNLYGQYYGDIPKRPLFLEMILRDVISGDIQKRNISELYLNYFLEKFDRDILGQFDKFTPQREIPGFSVDSLKTILIEIHEIAARSCFKNEGFGYGEEAIIENIIHEKEIRQRIAHFGLSSDIGKFISISVLTPISKRGNMNMKLKFVHKSFMEFFIARVICKELLFMKTTGLLGGIEYYGRYNYPDSILNFLGSCIESEIKNLGIEVVKKIIEEKINNATHKLNATDQYLIKKFDIKLIYQPPSTGTDDFPF